MRIVMFYHSAWSDWNHGNAHFLRGISTELTLRGHDVVLFEPADAWSYQNLVREYGRAPLKGCRAAYPHLNIVRYDPATLDLDRALAQASLVIVHEWNEHNLVKAIGNHRRRHSGCRVLFHDTHHRMVTAPETMAAYDLSNYDGVLAYGEVLRDLYERSGRVHRAWTWHEAADTRIFHPQPNAATPGDLVWIGNWGDDERARELAEFLIEPVRALALKTRLHGVRYPDSVRQALVEAGIEYRNWLPNFKVPQTFAQFRFTVHVQRRPYTQALPGIPTIRVFEALACGIPLICSPWDDAEKLFRPGTDYLLARDGREMTRCMRALLEDSDLARALAANGLETIRARHTCAHRADELLAIYDQLSMSNTTALAQ